MIMNLFRGRSETRLPNILALILSGVNLVLPLDWLFELVLGQSGGEEDSRDYQMCRKLFVSEYDRSNPVTREQATL
jgi:hypothetical protein